MATASLEGVAKLEGVYKFEHPGGEFEVHLRPELRFFAPKFQAKATWHITETGELTIDWGKFGQYALQLKDPPTRTFEGSAVGKPENWRKVRIARAEPSHARTKLTSPSCQYRR